MNSSVLSADTDRSSSSLDWEHDCDEKSENRLQYILDSIDNAVFFDAVIPKEFPIELVNECLLWKDKFNRKFHRNLSQTNIHAVKSLSAPKASAAKIVPDQRSLSEQNFLTKLTKLEAIDLKPNLSKIKQKNLIRKTAEKHVVLPPIKHTFPPKDDQMLMKTKTKSFPMPPLIQTIEDMLIFDRRKR